MSTAGGKSRTSSAAGGHGGRMTAASTDTEMENPFKQPSDDMIFTFKDDMKNERQSKREQEKSLRVWEKNRPMREGCLRKLCETEIEPSALAINPKVQGKIQVSEAGGMNIPVERPKNRESRWQLIEKKREMFLVQHMIETKDKEIAKLMQHKNMRQMGLRCSEQLLQNDTQSFIDFFTKIKKKARVASDELEVLKQKRTTEANYLRTLGEKCGTKQTQINKMLEKLAEFNMIKVFTEKIDPDPENKAARKAQKKMIEEHIADKKAKALERKEAGEAGNSMQKGRRQLGGRKEQDNSDSDSDDDSILRLDVPDGLINIIEDPVKDRDYPVPFDSPDDLMNIFRELEDQNLILIQQSQENEEQIEVLKMEQLKLEKDMNQETEKLVRAKNDVDARIAIASNDKYRLERKTQDASQRISEEGQIKIRNITSKIVKNFDSSANRNESGILDMLGVIEAQVDCYAEFDAHVKKLTNDDVDKDKLGASADIEIYYTQQIKEIRSNKRKEKKIARDIEDAIQIKIKQQQRQDKKLKIPPLGVRRAMDVAQKKEFKKKKIVRVTRTQEDMDFEKYISESFTTMKESADAVQNAKN